MRVQYLGGLWTNSEDEVLKAAVMKYGMNQWARIASLLPRKSAKQCKARWSEWLSPEIRKTEWTREEEERLLHLAKVMPTQWRTIAPIIGRTAAQCVEHYERLIDDAQRNAAVGSEGADALPGAPGRSSDAPGSSTNAGAAGASKDAANVLPERRGRFDHDTPAETKPARPDAVDMNEEEKEMLSEARARLANTRGKKAKRKAREKQLEAAKRMAQLQKRRELKAAGIAVKPPKLKKGAMDLSKEIPYMMEPAPGFYDTREEDKIAARDKRDARGLGRLIEKYEDDRTARTRDAAAKREAAKRRFVFGDPGDQSGPSSRSDQVQQDEPPIKRSRLSLPAPQVSDAELESIAKAGLSRAQPLPGRGTVANGDLRPGTGAFGSSMRHPVLATPTGSILSSVPATPSITGQELWSETRDRQLRDIMKLQAAPTPLVGGDNTSLPESLDLDGSVTPRDALRSPNPLASPSSLSTSSFATRDMEDAELVKLEKARLQLVKRELKDGLDALPDPENEYQVNIDAFADADLRSDDDDADDIPEDAEDEEKRLAREGKQRLASAKARFLSSAARKGLPIPPIPPDVDLDGGFSREIRALVQRDVSVTSMLLDTDAPDGDLAEKILEAVGSDEDVTDESLSLARALVDEEAERVRLGSDQSTVASESDILKALKSGRDAFSQEHYVENGHGEVVHARDEADFAEVFRQRSAHVNLAEKSAKTQRKNLGVRLGGFESKWKGLCGELAAVFDETVKAREELACFTMLADAEVEAGPRRVRELQAAVEAQKQLERILQAEYARACEGAS